VGEKWHFQTVDDIDNSDPNRYNFQTGILKDQESER